MIRNFQSIFKFWKSELSPQDASYDEFAFWIDMWDAIEDDIDFVEDPGTEEIFSEGRKHGDKIGDGRKGTIDRKYIIRAMNLNTMEDLLADIPKKAQKKVKKWNGK